MRETSSPGVDRRAALRYAVRCVSLGDAQDPPLRFAKGLLMNLASLFGGRPLAPSLLHLLALCLLALPGCGDDAVPGGGPLPGSLEGSAVDDVGATDDASGSDAGPTGAGPSFPGMTGGPGQSVGGPGESSREPTPPGDELDAIPDDGRLELGEVCRRSGQCASGFCAILAPQTGDGACTTSCRSDEECIEGWRCTLLTSSVADADLVCIDPTFCIDRDGDGFGIGPGCRGPDCDDTDPTVYPGAPEFCNGIDNSCNGFIDDRPIGAGEPCSTGEPGNCDVGTFFCEFGELVCSPNNSPQIEVCNGRDMNCDGTIDTGNPGGGQPCTTGLAGICGIGETQCVGGEVRCVPSIRPGDQQEICNSRDMNCDGTVDSGFRDADGVYNQVENCGACGVDCNNFWPGGPELYNVRPVCAVEGGIAVCSYACLDGFVDADGVAENGCELLPDADAIYVSRPVNGGVTDAGCGAWDNPCATITLGLQRAQSESRSRVRVSDGVFRESVVLVNGISILGGHNNRNWVRNPEVFVSLIAGGGGSGADRLTVRAQGITAETELSGFTIQGENAAATGNAIAVYIRNSNQNLRIRNNQIFAGRGGNGRTGQAGTPGDGGAAGSNGQPRVVGGTCNLTAPAPGPGGSRTCPDLRGSGSAPVSGGVGGNSPCPVVGQRTGSGANGQGPSGGQGGLGPGHFQGSSGRCTVNTSLGVDPVPGLPGAPGADGQRGTRNPNANGAVSGGQWRGGSGGDGQPGGIGSGGGGGSAAAGLVVGSTRYFGASGGGGGSGGCGGAAGVGGTAGGGSFAIFLQFDNPTPDGAMPRIEDNTLNRGQGGDGGSGGTGGGGGDGGGNGRGGPASTTGGNTYDFCMFAGGDGAPGGRGGHGGGGAGGNGGISYDIAIHNGTPPSSYASGNTFGLPADVATGGAAGTGGNSSNTDIGVGEDGLPGGSGHLLSL